MEKNLARFIASASAELLNNGSIGVEKECLRVNEKGSISQKPHPMVLGSALTNPYITTDYSEALLELITPPVGEMQAVFKFLCDTQQYVYRHLGDELLWSTSMPCVVAGESSIPLARYGSSNAGQMKNIYRRGLGYRYGRVMQVIAGVHFNYSFSDAFWQALHRLEGDNQPLQNFISERYMGLIRSLQRVGWLIPYLFGASPAICKSFLGTEPTELESFDEFSYYGPYATSLRMGDIGYQNNKESESGIKACYDSLDAYVESLNCAIDTPCPDYEKIGVKVDGEYRQLNANILQIENEYYSTVRPKQILKGNEKPTVALKRRGVRYVELRSLDVNAFDPLGINAEQLRFLEMLMIFCLFEESPSLAAGEAQEIDANEMTVAHRGREPGLTLNRCGESVSLKQWAGAVCDALLPISELLDRDEGGRPYSAALAEQVEAVADPEKTPSARMLNEMRDNGEAFFHFANRMSQQHRRYFMERAVDDVQMALFDEQAKQSLRHQREIEESDGEDFDAFLADYFAQR
ncbi:glutamate--cysteine ligase [Candidatus Reidiella endopervernicosa]|uniref:Glutamate--cysteine ligase n=1 Tax=Candidatus Reidiella endopervernicosa TaxID=2738883 RepID=A0A6N0I103_9GAMM|nr:glutamate--cysteine ligase [Candidatus Reidiella endopervernicosa]